MQPDQLCMNLVYLQMATVYHHHQRAAAPQVISRMGTDVCFVSHATAVSMTLLCNRVADLLFELYAHLLHPFS